jgi:protein involved in polysaccharide export with SLBB domain
MLTATVSIFGGLAWRSPDQLDAADSGQASPPSVPSSQPNERHLIRVGDQLKIAIFDLEGEDTGDHIFNVKVADDGKISLPFIEPLIATGLKCDDLAITVSRAYRDAKLIKSARVSVWFSGDKRSTTWISG